MLPQKSVAVRRNYEEKFQIKEGVKLKYKYLLQCSLAITDDLLF